MDRPVWKGCVSRLCAPPIGAVHRRFGDRSLGHLVKGFFDVNVFFDRGEGTAGMLDHWLSNATDRLEEWLGCVKDWVRHVGNRLLDHHCCRAGHFEHGLADRFDRLDDRGHDGLYHQARLDGRSGDGLSNLANCLDHAGRGRLGKFCCRFQQRPGGL